MILDMLLGGRSSVIRVLMVLAFCGSFAGVNASSARPSPVSVPMSTSSVSTGVPKVAVLLNPEVLKRVMEDRDVMAHASLNSYESPAVALKQGPTPLISPTTATLKKYSFYGVMRVRAGLALTRRILTDYSLYPKMISYIDQADFNPVTSVLWVQGGIWHWRLSSRVHFESRELGWIHFTVIAGHFAGLQGDFYFEPLPPPPGARVSEETLVYFRGEKIGAEWPPAFVIEKGAEIVFGYTGRHMRSYIESQKYLANGVNNGITSGMNGNNGNSGNNDDKTHRSDRSIEPSPQVSSELPKPRNHL